MDILSFVSDTFFCWKAPGVLEIKQVSMVCGADGGRAACVASGNARGAGSAAIRLRAASGGVSHGSPAATGVNPRP